METLRIQWKVGFPVMCVQCADVLFREIFRNHGILGGVIHVICRDVILHTYILYGALKLFYEKDNLLYCKSKNI